MRHVEHDRERNVMTISDISDDADRLSHYYRPIDPDAARTWALNEAAAALVATGGIGAITALGGGALAFRLSTIHDDFIMFSGKLLLGLMLGFFAPFLWPFRRPWHSPLFAFGRSLSESRGWRRRYDHVAIRRLHHQTTPTAPGRIVGVERQDVRPLDMLYYQCAVVLVRARFRPQVPRTAAQKITEIINGVPVTVDKDNYKQIAAILIGLGFMVGGETSSGRHNYDMAPRWREADANTLLAALKAQRHRIRYVEAGASDDRSWS